LIIISAFQSKAQSFEVEVKERPLNKILVDLGKTHGLEFSFNDKLLRSCELSISKLFMSKDEMMSYLLGQCNLSYELVGGVYIINEKKVAEKKTTTCIFKAQVIDDLTKEPLPYSTLQIGISGLVSDVNGQIVYKTNTDQLQVLVSHIGYQVSNETYNACSDQAISLIPKAEGLKEVVVEANAKSVNTTVASTPGVIKLNHRLARFLPGNSDNTLFNMLRLQPGILAAGEKSNDLIIWGGYSGHTQIVFDGMTLFSAGSLNDHIGAVNPLIVKDVEVHKGAYNAHIGDRVGSFVNITSRSGNNNEFDAILNVNNQTTSVLVNIPILKKRSSLQLAGRKTYFDFYGWKDIRKKDISEPVYDFQDMNLKYSGKNKSGDHYYISVMGSEDDFYNQIEFSENDANYSFYRHTKKEQQGGSFYYGKKWNNAGLSSIKLAYSGLSTRSVNATIFEDGKDSTKNLKINNVFRNSIGESSFKLDHYFPSNKIHSLSAGIGLIQNSVAFKQDTMNQSLKRHFKRSPRSTGYIKDDISINRFLSMHPGLRIDVPLIDLKPYLQPRLELFIKPNDHWRFKLATGIYNQFITQNMLIDSLGTPLYFWNLLDSADKFNLESIHYVSGINYSFKKLELNIDGFYKITSGIDRYYLSATDKSLSYSNLTSRSYGIDLSLRTKFNKLDLWLGYTLSKTEEMLIDEIEGPGSPWSFYVRSPFDQRHELKLGAFLNLSPFHISVDYVYGSGLPNTIVYLMDDETPYSRFDIAFLYQIKRKRSDIQTGVSLLNIFNTENIRYNDFASFPNQKQSYPYATPFTPTIFFNINF